MYGAKSSGRVKERAPEAQENKLRAQTCPTEKTGAKKKSEGRQLPAIAAIAATAAITSVSATATAAATATAITAASATTAAAKTASTTAARALGLRSCFIHYQVPAPEVLTVEGSDGAIGFFIIGNFDEGETARLSCETIPNQTYRRGINTDLPKPLLQLFFRCVERKIADVKLLHLRTPSARNRMTIAERTGETLTAGGADRRRCHGSGRYRSVVSCMVSNKSCFCNQN